VENNKEKSEGWRDRRGSLKRKGSGLRGEGGGLERVRTKRRTRRNIKWQIHMK
jgi:hypothetical protein